MRKLEFEGDGYKTDFTHPLLMNAELLLAVLVPAPVAAGTRQDEYRFIQSAGTISFGAAPKLHQKVIALYNPEA